MLTFIYDNWVLLIILIALVVMGIQALRAFLKLSKQEKISIIKAQLCQYLLKLVADAEEDYEEMQGMGAIKRAQVIQQIYARYPILDKLINQQEFIAWIDVEIDKALDVLHDSLEEMQNEDD